MTEATKYGQLKSEKLADENLTCRQIAREISVFGITDRQRIFLIYLLALEIEDPQKMQEIAACIKEVGGEDVFLSQIKDGV